MYFKKIKINILFSILAVSFIACDSEVKNKNTETKANKKVEAIVEKVNTSENEPIDTTQLTSEKTEKNTPTSIELESNLRPFQHIALNKTYTNIIEFSAYDDDYDYRMLIGKKNGKPVALIYNWDWMENDQYNFTEGELIKVTWKMDSIVQAGDEEIVSIEEWAMDAKRIFSKNQKVNTTLINSQESERPKKDRVHETINYFEFYPDTIQNLNLSKFEVFDTYLLDSKKIVAAYDKEANPDIEKDWGNKLLLLNNENEILFQSFGVGEVYSYAPHFYKNTATEKIIIICQLAFEYCFGGNVFVYENGKITPVGLLDIESDQEEKCLTDIMEIQEQDNEIIFSFQSDSLILEPGSEDILIKNTGVKYIYRNKELRLTKSYE